MLIAACIRVVGPGNEGFKTLADVFALGSFVGYYVVLESLSGWTIGKLITGTRVVRFDGRKSNFFQILGRTFARFLPFEPR